MSPFRLLLCLTGLAFYFICKQFILARPTGVQQPQPAGQPQSSRQLTPEQSTPTTRGPKPQVVPHTEWLPSERGLHVQSSGFMPNNTEGELA
jgi:hypothetical protein